MSELEKRIRIEHRFENPELVTGFMEVKTEKFLDNETNLEYDFTLRSINININSNIIEVIGTKRWYTINGDVFKEEPYRYTDYDKKSKYEIAENVDLETGEVVETLYEKKLEDEFLPVTNWNKNIGESISNAIINRFKLLNGLD